MDPLGEMPRGSLCQCCRRERFAVYAGCEPLTEQKIDANPPARTCEPRTVVPQSKDAGVVATGPEIEVNASTLTGESHRMTIKLDNSVADLKQIVQANLGIWCYEQQLVSGIEVLQPDTAALKQIAGLDLANLTLDILVIRVARSNTRAQRIRMEGAQSAEVNGTYTRMNTNCYAKDGDGTIRIFRYEADPSWPAAWYIECRQTATSWSGMPDQTLGEESYVNLDDDENVKHVGFPLPLSGWEPWTGMSADPGQFPAPIPTPLA